MPLHALGQFVHEGVVSLMLAAVGGILMWPYRKVKAAYVELMEAVQSTKDELTTQRSNCLTTLQVQGDAQVKLLTKVADTLDSIHLETKAQTGFIQGLASPRRVAAARKK